MINRQSVLKSPVSCNLFKVMKKAKQKAERPRKANIFARRFYTALYSLSEARTVHVSGIICIIICRIIFKCFQGVFFVYLNFIYYIILRLNSGLFTLQSRLQVLAVHCLPAHILGVCPCSACRFNLYFNLKAR